MKWCLWIIFGVMPMLALVSCAERGGMSKHSAPAAGQRLQQERHAGETPALPGLGRTVFVKNCAHCHGGDGRGDEGPDLHNMDGPDEWLTNRILKGKKGQMTAFAGKLTNEQIREVIG
jgi:mono/diheme cytochrome c family protein